MDILQPIAAILLVMALLAAVLVLLKRRGAAVFRLPGVSGSTRRLEVVERVSLGPQHALILVRAGQRTLLVGTAPNSCQILEGSFGDGSFGDGKA
jgi:flagellar biogenesis protein FliO